MADTMSAYKKEYPEQKPTWEEVSSLNIYMSMQLIITIGE
jgi:hypothetical protein